jgi:hypothetical protein
MKQPIIVAGASDVEAMNALYESCGTCSSFVMHHHVQIQIFPVFVPGNADRAVSIWRSRQVATFTPKLFFIVCYFLLF